MPPPIQFSLFIIHFSLFISFSDRRGRRSLQKLIPFYNRGVEAPPPTKFVTFSQKAGRSRPSPTYYPFTLHSSLFLYYVLCFPISEYLLKISRICRVLVLLHMGRRNSSWHISIRERAVFTGIGFTSANISFISGKR